MLDLHHQVSLYRVHSTVYATSPVLGSLTCVQDTLHAISINMVLTTAQFNDHSFLAFSNAGTRDTRLYYQAR